MSTSPEDLRIPSLTLGWRLKMALAQSEWTAGSLCEHLGVSRQTLSRWMGDVGAPPTRAYIMQWALATGVDREWLETGVTPAGNDPEGGSGLDSDDPFITQEYRHTPLLLAA